MVANSFGLSDDGREISWNGSRNSGSKMLPNQVDVALRCDDDISFCSVYLNARDALRREFNGVVYFAVSCGNGVASGKQIINALIRSCVGEGLSHTLQRAELVHQDRACGPLSEQKGSRLCHCLYLCDKFVASLR